MNDKLKNYEVAPDPEVWERIEKTMHRRAVRRQAWTAAAGAAVVALAVVGVVLWPGSSDNGAAQPVMPDVAQVMPREEVSVVAVAQEPAATEAVAGETEAVASKPDKAGRAVVVEPLVAAPAQQAEERVVVPQPMTVPQPQQVLPSSKPAVEEAQAAAATAVVPQPSVEPAVVEAEPSNTPAKSSTTYGLEDTVLWLPNVFMPGSDDSEINVFRPRLNHPGDVLTNYRMTIFNRSGGQVFTSNDLSEGWDGKYWGREMPQAAYVYVIYYTDKDGFRHQRKGTVTLVR